jgi:cytochrome c553
MPAWPSQQRDDEAWAVVAFLRRMPSLGVAEYRRLARGEVAPLPNLVEPLDTPGAVTESCARCHGMDGLGRGLGASPKLAGQRLVYLFESMRAYTRGERHSGIMEPIAAGLGAEGARKLADYYAALPRPAPATGGDINISNCNSNFSSRGSAAPRFRRAALQRTARKIIQKAGISQSQVVVRASAVVPCVR